MQRYPAAPTSLIAVNSVQKNHSIEDLTPVKLNARVKARIELREQYFSDAVHFFLSAGSLFTSKSVKILRTEFHKAVASEEVKSYPEELKTKLKVLSENLDGSEQKI